MIVLVVPQVDSVVALVGGIVDVTGKRQKGEVLLEQIRLRCQSSDCHQRCGSSDVQ